MFKNTTILMIRHAEKPSSSKKYGLSKKGYQRAEAYIGYFQKYVLPGSKPLKLNYLFASEDSNHSDRPCLTIEPLAQALGLIVDSSVLDKDYSVLYQRLQQQQFDNVNILICWHHGAILKLADCLLGEKAKKLPGKAKWPAKWPSCVFGWLMQLSYDGDGNINPDQTFCINEELMPDDTGQEPPNFTC